MPDFPTAVPDIPNASSSETLFTMHGGTSHVTATNRILTNLQALATKLGLGASAPGSSPGVLRRTASNQSAWGPVVNADVDAGAAIAYGKLALGSSIVSGDLVDGTIATTDLAPHAASQSGFINIGGGATVGAGGGLVDVPGAFVDLAVQAAGEALVVASITLSCSVSTGFGYLALIYDAVTASTESPAVFPLANAQIVIATVGRFPGLPAGTRRFKAQWRGTAGTTTLFGLQMWALELKR